jgi:hypothetical protein
VLLDDDRSDDRLAATAGQRLRACVREDFGIDPTSLDAVGHGADEAAELRRGASVDGRRTQSS